MPYFKIPIERTLPKIKIQGLDGLRFNASQWDMINGLEEHRFWVHISARRTGKSIGAAILAFNKLLEPRTPVLVVAPNFSLGSIVWDYTTEIIRNLNIETRRFSNKDRVVELINGSVLRLLSANNRDSLVGRAAKLLIIDEAAVIENDEYYRRDLRPTLSTFPDSRALFISTPRGKANYLYEYFNRGQSDEWPNWGSCRHTWKSNPLLNEEDIKEAEASLTQKMFAQEYLCDWTIMEMQIYLMNDEHLKDLSGLHKNRLQFIGGLDVGYRDENAFVVIGTDDENYYIVDEFIRGEIPTSELASEMNHLIEKWGIENIYIDSAAQQLKADLAYEYDIYCDNAIRSVNDGIAAVQTLVEKNRLICDVNNASGTFHGLSNYKWKDTTELPKPVHDAASHPSDAVRYAVYSHQRNMASITI